MELAELSPGLKDLRDAIISSNLASCYLILQAVESNKDDPLIFDAFRKRWLDAYKGFYNTVSAMRVRRSSRDTGR